MLDFFGSIKGFLKLEHVRTDNNVFRLHYKGTLIVLLACSLLITARQYIGDPIDCVVEEIPHSVMDTYCWIHSTYSVTSKHQGTPGKHFVQPGVAPVDDDDCGEDGCRYHKYYQWVCFTLFFQALLCYIPRYIWKSWENGKMKSLVEGMCIPIMAKEKKEEKIAEIVFYFHHQKGRHDFYAAKFFFCEVLNLINIIGQIFFMDKFLGGEFTQYGAEVIRQSELPIEEREDPMDKVFPKITKCTFHKFGPSGTVENFDGLCVLPLNIINEKIYIFLWFWFIIVSIISGLYLIYRMVSMATPTLRERLLHFQSRINEMADVQAVCNKYSSIGDWFLLYQMGKNIDPLIMRDLIVELGKNENQSKMEMR